MEVVRGASSVLYGSDAIGGVRFLRNQHLGVAVENVGNALYAEAPNVGFLRPEPKRKLTVSLQVSF